MHQPKKSLLFIIAVLLIFPIPQIAIDLYLPSLPSMVSYFNTTSYYSLLTLTFYLLSLGIAQLIYGPCSDRWGRKPVLLAGIVIFFIGSIACVMASSIEQLIIFRVIQGFGMGCGLVVASAILGDSFTGKPLAKMTTWSSTIFSLSVLLAPLLGGYLQTVSGWRANFIFMASGGGIVFLTTLFFIPETNKQKDASALNLYKVIRNYFSIVSNIRFMCYVICLLFGYSLGITFNVVGPFLLQNIFHLSVMYSGIMLFLTGMAYLAGTLSNNHILNFFTVNTAILIGIMIMLGSAISLLFSGLAGWFTPLSIMLFTCLSIFGVGFIFPNCFAKGLEFFPEKLGSASAIISSAGLVGVSLVGGIVARISIHSAIALGVAFFIEAVGCLISYVFIKISYASSKA